MCRAGKPSNGQSGRDRGGRYGKGFPTKKPTRPKKGVLVTVKSRMFIIEKETPDE